MTCSPPSFDNEIYRVKLNAAGDGVVLEGQLCLQRRQHAPGRDRSGRRRPIPRDDLGGATTSHGAITVFEPNDFGGGGPPCTGADDPALDEDGDGFNNADEIDNGTNPCSAADVPPDCDGDNISNLNDPDDDNDGQPDTSDPFAIDAAQRQPARLCRCTTPGTTTHPARRAAEPRASRG